jgi:hypothetical protein
MRAATRKYSVRTPCLLPVGGAGGDDGEFRGHCLDQRPRRAVRGTALQAVRLSRRRASGQAHRDVGWSEDPHDSSREPVQCLHWAVSFATLALPSRNSVLSSERDRRQNEFHTSTFPDSRVTNVARAGKDGPINQNAMWLDQGPVRSIVADCPEAIHRTHLRQEPSESKGRHGRSTYCQYDCGAGHCGLPGSPGVACVSQRNPLNRLGLGVGDG